MITHTGGCHCGRVRFEVDAPAELSIDECNCSMCARTAYLHLIVNADRFRITRGKEALTTYTFNTGTAKHFFCTTCGIKAHRLRHRDGHEDHTHRRPQLGEALSGRTRRIHRLRKT